MAIQEGIRQGGHNRQQAIEVIRFLNAPMLPFARRRVRAAVEQYAADHDFGALLATIDDLRLNFQGQPAAAPGGDPTAVSEADLHLVCFEYIS
ncbi:MAG: hypothetical protein HUU35_03505 [Armatimonadetes bacterium]|nr:hypothetical protein [Armatimonadota bacterium]